MIKNLTFPEALNKLIETYSMNYEHDDTFICITNPELIKLGKLIVFDFFGLQVTKFTFNHADNAFNFRLIQDSSYIERRHVLSKEWMYFDKFSDLRREYHALA